jgi:hypothetical protein
MEKTFLKQLLKNGMKKKNKIFLFNKIMGNTPPVKKYGPNDEKKKVKCKKYSYVSYIHQGGYKMNKPVWMGTFSEEKTVEVFSEKYTVPADRTYNNKPEDYYQINININIDSIEKLTQFEEEFKVRPILVNQNDSALIDDVEKFGFRLWVNVKDVEDVKDGIKKKRKSPKRKSPKKKSPKKRKH